jgi:Zn-finger nucleic acid-binding protein
MAIIGVSGKIGSGKDLTGKIIQYLTHPFDRDFNTPFKIDDNYNGGVFKVKKLAGKLKDIVCVLIGCTKEQLEDAEFKNKKLGEEWWYYRQHYTTSKNSKIVISEPMLPFRRTNSGFQIKQAGKLHLYKLTPRLFLQLIGTECGRNIIHPNIWVNALMSEYKPTGDISLKGEVRKDDLIYPNWIISDLRFPNEMKAVKDREGITIRVNRDHRYFLCDNCMAENISVNEMSTVNEDTCPRCNIVDEGNLTMVIEDLSKHESETALDNAEFDYTIENNGTIEDLIEKVRVILTKEKII